MTAHLSGTVAVLGSINMDIVLRVARFPRAGETIAARAMTRHPGGKGANQAVAAARAGASVRMIGAIGDDADGAGLREILEREGIDCSAVRIVPDAATGTACILVDDAGENQITVSGGANLLLERPSPAPAAVSLAQLESPLEAVMSFLRDRPPGSIGILNAAPHHAESGRLFAAADIVVLNETELALYCGETAVPDGVGHIASLARRALAHDGQKLVVTLGKAGSMTVTREAAEPTPAPSAEAVDTTGAGDCFCGYLAARLAQGWELSASVAEAHRAAALAVARPGAIASMPFTDALATSL